MFVARKLRVLAWALAGCMSIRYDGRAVERAACVTHAALSTSYINTNARVVVTVTHNSPNTFFFDDVYSVFQLCFVPIFLVHVYSKPP